MDSWKAEEENQRQLQAAMKAVGQAIQLDSSGNSRDAYLHYLSCMQYISQCLLHDARSKASQSSCASLKTKTSQRMVKLAQQCSERVTDIMSNMEETSSMVTSTVTPPHLATSPAPSPLPVTSSLPAQGPVGGRISPSMFPPVPTSFSHSSPTHVAVVRPTVQHPGHQSLPLPSVNSAQASDDSLGPLEKAFRENRKLMAAYRSRLNRMHASKNKAMVNLTFQRRLMENMAIAKAREASLAKKIKERQQRLQEQAAQRFSSSGQPTKEELEMRMMYANILEYENVKNWLQDWRRRLQESPNDTKLVKELITEILSCDDHPLTQLLKQYQITIYHKIMPLIQKELPHIEEIVVPYKEVQPIDLQGPRAVPEGGFTTPDELDQTMEDTLNKRLFALRDNSSSSLDSEPADSRHASQTEGEWCSASRLQEDVLDELLEEEEVEEKEEEGLDIHHPVFHDEDAASNNVAIEGHHKHSRMNESEERHIDGENKDDDDDDDDAGGLENGQDPSSFVDATTERNTIGASSSAEVDMLNDDVDVDDDGDVVGRMKDIVGEVREEVERALEDGERCCKELEQRDDDDDDDVDGEDIDAEVAVAASTSMGDPVNGDCGNSSFNGVENKERTVKPDFTNDDDDEKRTKLNDVGERSAGRSGLCENHEGVVEEEGDQVSPEMHDSSRNGNLQEERAHTCEHNFKTKDSDKDDKHSEIEAELGEDGADREKTVGNGTVKADLTGEGKKEEGADDEEKEKDAGAEKIAEMRAEAIQRHVKTISKDVLMFTERVHNLLVAVYEQLNSTVAKEQCIAVIETFFFKDIWKPLLMLFRRSNYMKEQYVAIAMTKYRHAMPQHIGVGEKFCLLSEGALQDGCQAVNGYPYQQAVEELCRLQEYTCPLKKLECVVRVSRVIIECVEDFYESQGKPRQSPENAVGCDDLLPILSYVIMKSSIPQIVSECSAMEEFIHEGYLFGEEGYCLTTCMTALSYVLKLGSTDELPT